MKTNKFLNLSWRVIVSALCLTLAQIIIQSLGTTLLNVETPKIETNEGLALLLMFCVSLVNSIIFLPLFLKSSFKKIPRILSAGLVFFVVYSGLSMLELALFNGDLKMSPAMILVNLVSALLSGLVFSYIAVNLTEKFNQPDEAADQPWTNRTARSIIPIALLLIIVIYPLLYFVFGSLATLSPALKNYYLISMGNNSPIEMHILYAFQIFRASIWLGAAFLLMLQLKGPRTPLIVGAIFALGMNMVHILPNPYMPPDVRLVHFFETAVSNFIWGFLCVWLLRGKQRK